MACQASFEAIPPSSSGRKAALSTGTLEENAWAFAKARYDAETFWYRGSGRVPPGRDGVAEAAVDASKDRDRSVILYGNAQTSGMTALPSRFAVGRPY